VRPGADCEGAELGTGTDRCDEIGGLEEEIGEAGAGAGGTIGSVVLGGPPERTLSGSPK
jgi:hypothetical protein